MQIEPDTKIVQGYFCSQTSLKSGQIVGPFASQTERVQQLVIDRFDDLPQTDQPSAQGFGPVLLAALMRRSDQIDLVAFLEAPPRSVPCEPFISHIRAVGKRGDEVWRAANRVAAKCWSCVLALPKPNPVMTP